MVTIVGHTHPAEQLATVADRLAFLSIPFETASSLELSPEQVAGLHSTLMALEEDVRRVKEAIKNQKAVA